MGVSTPKAFANQRRVVIEFRMKAKKKPAARTEKGDVASANASPRVREDSQRPNARHLERITFNSARNGGKAVHS
jgi:hypothetical protein